MTSTREFGFSRLLVLCLARALTVVVAVLVLWCGAMQHVFAHASLVSTEPADGAVLAGAPDRLVLTFNEPVAPLVLELIGPSGRRQALTDARLRGHTLEVAAPPALADGTHVLSWRVVSEDGHPVGGAVVFSIGAPSAAPPSLKTQNAQGLLVALWASKMALYAGLFFGVGGVFAATWLARNDDGQRFLVACLALGIVGVALGVGFQGLDAMGRPLSQLAQVESWRAGMATSFGQTAAYGLLAFVAALWAVATSGSTAQGLSLVALAAVGASLAASGHASSAKPEWLMRSVVFSHAMSVGFWIGALVPLGLALRRDRTGAIDALLRFSRAIPFVLAVLALSGVVLAVVQVEMPSALVATTYGSILMTKLLLLAALFGLAIFNRYRLTKRVAARGRGAVHALVRSIASETLIVMAVFAAVAAWRFTPPPRVLAIAAARPAHVHLHGERAMADIVFRPGRPGPVVVEITVLHSAFDTLDAKEVSLLVANDAAGIAAIRRQATQGEAGTWTIEELVLPFAGRWTVRVDILVDDFELAKLSGEVEIGR